MKSVIINSLSVLALVTIIPMTSYAQSSQGITILPENHSPTALNSALKGNNKKRIPAKNFNEGLSILKKIKFLDESEKPASKGKTVPYCRGFKLIADTQANIEVSLKNEPEGAQKAFAALQLAAKKMRISPSGTTQNGTPYWEGSCS